MRLIFLLLLSSFCFGQDTPIVKTLNPVTYQEEWKKLNLGKGQKGDRGEQGPQGIPGPTGPQGLPGGNSGQVSPLWQAINNVQAFGAIPNDGKDDIAAFRAASEDAIKRNVRTVVIPFGRYNFSKPWIIMNPTGGFVTLNIIGESSFWDANTGSEIHCDFSNTFAIGIQLGKGCKISNLTLVGKFQPPSMADRKKFFNTKFEDFTDKVSRDSKYSPYSAIVIDPFTVNVSDPLPPDGGYPGLSEYYSRTGWHKQTGSTGIDIQEMKISNFVIGVCLSPNGLTRNAEIITLNKIQFESLKLCISSGQDQEKMNQANNIYCWGNTHTIFANGLYGIGNERERSAGQWFLSGGNFAGGIVRLVRIEQQGYFGTHIEKWFGESIGRIGVFSGSVAMSFSKSHIDFEYPDQAGFQTLLTSWGPGRAAFRDNDFRYYGRPDLPMYYLGKPIFDNTEWSGPLRNEAGTNHIDE